MSSSHSNIPPMSSSPTQLSEEDLERAEIARQRTVNFLSKLAKEGSVREYRHTNNDQLEERCYFRCLRGMQSAQGVNVDQRRPRKIEPVCGAMCYIKLKDPFQEPAPKPSTSTATKDGKEFDDSKYRISALKGKYLYSARGRLAIAKHAEGEPTVESIRQLEQDQKGKRRVWVDSKGDELSPVWQAVLTPDHYENLYPLCTSISSRLQRFENHLVRIYSPTYRLVSKFPEIYNDGTYGRIIGQLYEKAVNGEGLALGVRLVNNGVEMAKKVIEKGSGKGGPFGGLSGAGGGSSTGVDGPVPPPPTIGPSPAPPPA